MSSTAIWLAERLLERLQAADKHLSGTVVVAGHFALMWYEAQLGDHLEFDEDEPIEDKFQQFADETWRAGVAMARREMGIKLLVLVNDWQYLDNKAERSHPEREKRAKAALEHYYGINRKWPKMYHEYCEGRINPDQCVEAWSQSRWMFSERELRSRFVNRLRGLFREGSLQKYGVDAVTGRDTRTYLFERECHGLSDYLSDERGRMLARGNSTNCAGEVIELIRVLKGRGITRVVIMHPEICYQYVNAGALIAKCMFGENNMELINVSVPCKAALDRVQIVSHQV